MCTMNFPLEGSTLSTIFLWWNMILTTLLTDIINVRSSYLLERSSQKSFSTIFKLLLKILRKKSLKSIWTTLVECISSKKFPPLSHKMKFKEESRQLLTKLTTR